MLMGSSALAVTLPKAGTRNDRAAARHELSQPGPGPWLGGHGCLKPSGGRQAAGRCFSRRPPCMRVGAACRLRRTRTRTARCAGRPLNESVIPRFEPKDAPLAEFLDQQIGQLAREAPDDTKQFYARIQAQYQNGLGPQQIESTLPKAASKLKPHAPAAELRDL